MLFSENLAEVFLYKDVFQEIHLDYYSDENFIFYKCGIKMSLELK